VWVSALINSGLADYTARRDSNEEIMEEFDYDWRDPNVDKGVTLGGGYMTLGIWTHAIHGLLNYGGGIHHLELHHKTLGDDDVSAVIETLLPIVEPEAKVHPCQDCAVGMADLDEDPTSECEPCGVGTFNNFLATTTCVGRCPIGSTGVSVGSVSIEDCVRCKAGSYGIINTESVPQCVMCAAGQVADTIGATSSAICSPCRSGTFSAPGSTTCYLSGCTDPWADNYDPSAIVDEGECVYTCAKLLARTGAVNNGGCMIHNNGTWSEHNPYGPMLSVTRKQSVYDEFSQLWKVDPNISFSVVTDEVWNNIYMFDDGEDWVIQGHPQPGSTMKFPLYVGNPHRVTLIEANVTLRYVFFSTFVPNAYHDPSNFGVSQANGPYLETNFCPSKCRYDLDHVQFEDFDRSPIIWVEGSLSDGLFVRNVAKLHGGALRSRIVSQMPAGGLSYDARLVRRTRFIENGVDASTGSFGGAIAVTHRFIPTRVDSSDFVGNFAPKGGAIYVASSCGLEVFRSSFDSNRATIYSGGAIFADMDSDITIIDSPFTLNVGMSSGGMLYLNGPASVKVRHCEFSPFEAGAGTVYLAGQVGGCEKHACDPGFSCDYEKYSLVCTPCMEPTVSVGGKYCTPCPAGTGPMQDKTGCIDCPPGQASVFGVCAPCLGDTVPNEAGSACVACLMGTEPSRTPGQAATECNRCQAGHYNSSYGVVLCPGQNDPGQTQRGVCQPCGECLDCRDTEEGDHVVLVKSGFALGPAAATQYQGIEHGDKQIDKVFHKCAIRTMT
jgi:hypothetical protein